MISTPQDALFVGLPAERDVVARFIIEGEPVSKARARFTNYGQRNGRAYTPEKTRHAEEQMAASYRAAGGRLEPDSEVTFGVSAVFYNGTRQRRDVDNMLKLVLDGLNKVAWADDNQVVEVSGRKRFTGDRTTAQTEVVVYRVGRIDRHHQNCQFCGVEFITYASWAARKFCSAECISNARRKIRERNCEGCGAVFLAHGPSKTTRFCGNACKDAAGWTEVVCEGCSKPFARRICHVRERNYCTAACREAANPRKVTRKAGTCVDCGDMTADGRAKRCRSCNFIARRKSGVV